LKPDEIKIFAYVTVGFSAAIWLATILFAGAPPLSIGSLKALNVSAGTVSIAWTVYFSWGWKQPYARRVLFRPNLNGTWIGQFKSDWTGPDGAGVRPGRFVLVVRQSFFAISVRAFSERQKTSSYVESLVCDDGRGTKFLAYLFQEKRTSNGDHGARHGAAELDLIEDRRSRFLEGEFWTISGTTGFVRVRQSSAELYVESIADAYQTWADMNDWANV
jgi:hypothetical protein